MTVEMEMLKYLGHLTGAFLGGSAVTILLAIAYFWAKNEIVREARKEVRER